MGIIFVAVICDFRFFSPHKTQLFGYFNIYTHDLDYYY